MSTLTAEQARLLKAIHAELGSAEFTAHTLLHRCAGAQSDRTIVELRDAIIGVCGHKYSRIKMGRRLRKFVDIRHEDIMLERDKNLHDGRWHYRVAEFGAPLSPELQAILKESENRTARRDMQYALAPAGRRMDLLCTDMKRDRRAKEQNAKDAEHFAGVEARRVARAQLREDAQRQAAEARATDEALGPELIVHLNRSFSDYERAEPYRKLPYAKWIQGNERSKVDFNLGRGVAEQKRRHKELMAAFAQIRTPGDEIEGIPPEVLIDRLMPGASRDPQDYVDYSARRAYLLLDKGDTTTPLDHNRRGQQDAPWSPFDQTH